VTEGSRVALAPGPELLAIAALWRATGRQIITSFLGTSMLPTIAPGVDVTIDCARQWETGDIIAYVAGDMLVVHRIEAISPDRTFVLTRGDHHRIPDDPFEPSGRVIGTIVAIRQGNEWVTPPPAPRTWIRDHVMTFVMRGFTRGLRTCRRRIIILRLLTRPSIIAPILLGKARRLIRPA